MTSTKEGISINLLDMKESRVQIVRLLTRSPKRGSLRIMIIGIFKVASVAEYYKKLSFVYKGTQNLSKQRARPANSPRQNQKKNQIV